MLVDNCEIILNKTFQCQIGRRDDSASSINDLCLSCLVRLPRVQTNLFAERIVLTVVLIRRLHFILNGKGSGGGSVGRESNNSVQGSEFVSRSESFIPFLIFLKHKLEKLALIGTKEWCQDFWLWILHSLISIAYLS